MKQFNLELAKQGKPVCTRDGRDVEILKWDIKNSTYPIISLINNEEVLFATEKGKSVCDNIQSCSDLFMKSEKKEGWVNLYETKKGVKAGNTIFDSRNEAVRIGSSNNYLATVKIEWEE